MRKPILACATVLALAAGMTTSAVALDHKADNGGSHAGRVHARGVGGMHSFRARGGGRVVRSENSHHGGWSYGGSDYHGDFIDLGPLGITAACGSHYHRRDYCGQGYPVSAWSR